MSRKKRKNQPNPVAKHSRTYNRAKVFKDRKKEMKKNPPKEVGFFLSGVMVIYTEISNLC